MIPAGIDGCKSGWAVVTGDENNIELQIFTAFKDVLRAMGPNAIIAVDIPIGLLTKAKKGGRECEGLARSLLKPRRHNSIFSSPVHAALKHLNNYEKAKEANLRSSEARRGLSRQSFSIMPKIKEVDDIMTPDKQARVFEGHPELSFMEMAMRY